MNSPWSAFEHKLWRKIQKQELKGSTVLVAVSGGLDSMVLAHALMTLSKAAQMKLKFCYVHHGPGENLKFRDESLRFLQNWAQIHEQDLISPEASVVVLKGEKELREYRYQILKKIIQYSGAKFVATAHHQDDLLETRLLRLLRGTGPRGLRAIKERRGNLWRPLLDFSKAEILDYAIQRKIEWLEDPSNQQTHYLRNWLRKTWLEPLKKAHPGLDKSLARSLELLANSLDQLAHVRKMDFSQGIKRPDFTALSRVEKKQLLASYLLAIGQEQFTHNQLEEIIKHLDKLQNVHTFTLAYCQWQVNAERILAERLGNSH